MSFLERLFSTDGFMPHGMCYEWNPVVIWIHVLSDGVIALSYYSIPLTLLYFVRRRTDLSHYWIFLCFAAFIVACGTTHLMEIVNIWHPTYWFTGLIKTFTAIVSVITAVLLIRLMPFALAVPSHRQLDLLNEGLRSETKERVSADERVARLNLDLIENNIRLSLAVKAAQIGDWELDLRTQSVLRSPRHNQIFGYAELLPNWDYSLFLKHVHPEDRARVDENFQGSAALNEDLYIECRIIRTDREVRWVYIQGRFFKGDPDHPDRLIGFGDVKLDDPHVLEEIDRYHAAIRRELEA